VLYAVIGLLAGGIFTLVTLFATLLGAAYDQFEELPSLLFGVGSIILLPVFYGLMGFLAGLLGAFLYNVAAGFIGGIELEVAEPAVRPLTTAGGGNPSGAEGNPAGVA
jgi:hypothetical protein